MQQMVEQQNVNQVQVAPEQGQRVEEQATQPEQSQQAHQQSSTKPSTPVAERVQNAWWWQLVRSPWVLLAVPLLIGGFWLANNTHVITDNLDKPYLLLAGPALVGSILAGWLVVAFFQSIVKGVVAVARWFREWSKKDGSAFWLVIWVFLLVSVAESGTFFNAQLGPINLYGTLGFAVAFVIDLVSVMSMRARIVAVRMHDKNGAQLHLFIVFVCALVSTFANGYTSLEHFQEPAGTLLPLVMVKVAPWIGMLFPLLSVGLTFSSDYVADQTSGKLDPDEYAKQEEKRLKLLEIQRDKLKLRVELEKDIEGLTLSRKKKGKDAANSEKKSKEKKPVSLTFFWGLFRYQNAAFSEQILALTQPLNVQIQALKTSLENQQNLFMEEQQRQRNFFLEGQQQSMQVLREFIQSFDSEPEIETDPEMQVPTSPVPAIVPKNSDPKQTQPLAQNSVTSLQKSESPKRSKIGLTFREAAALAVCKNKGITATDIRAAVNSRKLTKKSDGTVAKSAVESWAKTFENSEVKAS